jgi:hypothetical protein
MNIFRQLKFKRNDSLISLNNINILNEVVIIMIINIIDLCLLKSFNQLTFLKLYRFQNV